MRRRLRNFSTDLSLVLCVAVLALWARSYGRGDGISRYPYLVDRREYRQQAFISDDGRLCAQFAGQTVPTDRAARRMAAHVVAGGFQNRWRRYTKSPSIRTIWHARPWRARWEFSLRWGTQGSRAVDPGGKAYHVFVSVPHWLPAALLAVAPLRRGVAIFKSARRRGRGLCASCGYDLHATPGRCPECGTAAAASRVG